MEKQKIKKLIIAFLLIDLIVISAIIWYQFFMPTATQDVFAQDNASVIMPAVNVQGQFELQTVDGKPVTYQDFLGKPTLVYFGYTFCPDYCPTTLQTFKQVNDLLKKQNSSVQMLFISVDPERDTPQQLKQYMTLFDKDIIALTGTPENLHQATKNWRAFYAINKKTDGDQNYTVDHTVYTYYMNSAGELKAMFKDTATAQDIMDTIQATQ